MADEIDLAMVSAGQDLFGHHGQAADGQEHNEPDDFLGISFQPVFAIWRIIHRL